MCVKLSVGYRALPIYWAFLKQMYGIDQPRAPGRELVVYWEGGKLATSHSEGA
ncbi:hypothetical protein [Microvirga splendida]|uniref:Uncharacterized protein n=1 Tax=Microvirga splendida TaxID=2795727 RepID=A0ABS0XZE8_9HYPH|nr:hypothetical protein [Microvirga splendida]MBJ6125389.1 hypothetical protein [Microvirga splendida]